MKFKVGDRVKFNSRDSELVSKGDTGVIVSFGGPNGIYIDFKTAGLRNRGLEELDYIRYRDTKLARKVHKNNIRGVKKGWIYLK